MKQPHLLTVLLLLVILITPVNAACNIVIFAKEARTGETILDFCAQAIDVGLVVDPSGCSDVNNAINSVRLDIDAGGCPNLGLIEIWHNPILPANITTVTNTTVTSNASSYNDSGVFTGSTETTTTQNTSQDTMQNASLVANYVSMRWWPRALYTPTDEEHFTFFLRPVTREQYKPPQTTFIVESVGGKPEEDVNITVDRRIGRSSVSGNLWDSDQQFTFQEQNITLVTGRSGTATLAVYPSSLYTLSYNKTSISLDDSFTDYPYGLIYTYLLNESVRYYLHGIYDIYQEINVSANVTEINDTHAIITAHYTSNITGTTNLTIYLNQTTARDWINTTNLAIFRVNGSNNVVHNFTVEDYAGLSYLVSFRVNHSEFGRFRRDLGVRFPGLLVDLGLPEDMYLIISIGLLIFVGSVFGATTATSGSLVVCIMGWILWGIGWFIQYSNAILVALPFATVISVFAILSEKSKREGLG